METIPLDLDFLDYILQKRVLESLIAGHSFKWLVQKALFDKVNQIGLISGQLGEVHSLTAFENDLLQ